MFLNSTTDVLSKICLSSLVRLQLKNYILIRYYSFWTFYLITIFLYASLETNIIHFVLHITFTRT